MEFSTLTETHIKGAPRICDEIKNELQKKFPGRYVNYLHSEPLHVICGYKISGSLTSEEETEVEKLMTDMVEKVLKERESNEEKAKQFMEFWHAPVLQPSDNKVCLALRRTFNDMLGYVESHRNCDPVTARSFAKYSDTIGKVYKLFYNCEFEKAADAMFNSSDVVRGSVDRKTYNAIMKHHKVA